MGHFPQTNWEQRNVLYRWKGEGGETSVGGNCPGEVVRGNNVREKAWRPNVLSGRAWYVHDSSVSNDVTITEMQKLLTRTMSVSWQNRRRQHCPVI